MRHRWMRHSGRWLALLLLALAPVAVGVVLLAPPVRADGVTVALSTSNGTSFTYNDDSPPLFTVVVTFSTKPTVNNCGSVTIQLDSGQSFGAGSASSLSADGLTWTYTRLRPVDAIPVGARSAVATFLAPGTSCAPVQSSPFNFTVNKAALSLDCGIDTNSAPLGITGQTLHIQMSALSGQQLPAEWQTGTYTVALDGPTHITAADLTSDSNNVVTMVGPTQRGLYTLTCTFNGSASYTSSTITVPNPYRFSALHSLGVVNLYTNPTTLVAGRGADFYVAFHPASGWPMPTGQFSLWLGQNYTNPFTLGASGDFLIHLVSVPSLADVSHVEIDYFGDVNYAGGSILFPLTNPPIPSGTNAGGTGNGSLGAGNKPQGTAVATATGGGDETTPTTVGVGRAVPATTTPSSGIGGGVILAVILALLGLVVIGGGIGGAIYLMRRRASIAAPGAMQPQDGYGWPGAPTNQWDAWGAPRQDYPPDPQYPPGRGYPPDSWDTRGQGGQGQWDDTTQPYRRGDR